VLTGVLYLDPEAPTFLDLLQLPEEPLATLPPERTRPPRQALAAVLEEFR
jgi:2-oxoglutarate/2-oxoacid ferredoxin oxidoreductase subunit beta